MCGVSYLSMESKKQNKNNNIIRGRKCEHLKFEYMLPTYWEASFLEALSFLGLLFTIAHSPLL
jgi:hypothetical protein